MAVAPLLSPRRREILVIGRTMVRTGKDKIIIYVGRGLILRAVAKGVDPGEEVDVERWFAPFERANPGLDTKEAKRLVRAAQPEELLDFGEYETGISSPATAVGSGFLLAVLMALGVAWPTRRGIDDGPKARMARANWAWLGILPAAMADGRAEWATPFMLHSGAALLAWGLMRTKWGRWPAVAVAAIGAVAGLAMVSVGAPLWGLPSLLWLGAALIPERGRTASAAVFLAFAAGGLTLKAVGSHDYHGFYLVLGAILLTFAARKAMPSNCGLTALPAIAACLWLVGLGGELIADAQTGAALERLRHVADDFRRERSI